MQNNYVNILWMLLRLRQACDHPMLVKKCHKSEAFHKSTLEAARKLAPPQRIELIQCLEGGQMICPICQVFSEEVHCSGGWNGPWTEGPVVLEFFRGVQSVVGWLAIRDICCM